MRFKGGPADGVTIELNRAPILLRVVQSRRGKWDALDQLGDSPASDETLYLYRIDQATHRTGHISYSEGGRRKGRFFIEADYLFVEDQPAESVLRSNQCWVTWCETEEAKKIADKSGQGANAQCTSTEKKSPLSNA